MALGPNELVIVLGRPGTSVLDVNTVERVLSHLVDHVVLQATQTTVPPGLGPRTAAPDPHHHRSDPYAELRFFASNGERLELRIDADWWTFCLEPTGHRMPLRRLETEVHAALEAGRPAVESFFASIHLTPPELPPPGEWPAQLVALQAMDPSHQPSDIQGWFHNFFVHGKI